MSKHILIVGSGSVGKRHARNLQLLGCDISCVDPRIDRIRELSNETDVVGGYVSLEEAYKSIKYDGAVIASPTAFHVEQCTFLLNNVDVILLEKPVAKSLRHALELQKQLQNSSTKLLLGYTWRWWKPLKQVKSLLESGKIGKIRHVQFHMSAHLEDWHPWESYKDFFMSSKELGGGALLDESHWIDLLIWFFGMPEELFGRIEKISSLDMETDDNVDVLLSYKNNLKVSLHLDLYGRPHEKFIRFIGDGGTIFWTAEPNRILVSKEMSQNWDEEHFDLERNDMFLDLARDFLNLFEPESEEPACTLEDGIQVLQVIETIRISNIHKTAQLLNYLNEKN